MVEVKYDFSRLDPSHQSNMSLCVILSLTWMITAYFTIIDFWINNFEN